MKQNQQNSPECQHSHTFTHCMSQLNMNWIGCAFSSNARQYFIYLVYGLFGVIEYVGGQRFFWTTYLLDGWPLVLHVSTLCLVLVNLFRNGKPYQYAVRTNSSNESELTGRNIQNRKRKWKEWGGEIEWNKKKISGNYL